MAVLIITGRRFLVIDGRIVKVSSVGPLLLEPINNIVQLSIENHLTGRNGLFTKYAICSELETLETARRLATLRDASSLQKVFAMLTQ